MNEVIAQSETRVVSVAARSTGPGMGALLERAKAFVEQPAVKRARPAMVALALVAIAALVWSLLATPPQRDLSRGVSDADKAAITDALNGAGIKYHIDSGDGAVSVAEADYYRAKMLLAAQGLPKAPPSASDTLASLPMGASRAVEGERLLDAREADLARTIETIDAVATAKVHLAAEQPSVFLREQKDPAASVMLKLQPGRELTQSQVTAIASLVAASVPGLAPEAVSIVDQTGRLLSRGAGDPASAAADRQVALQSEVEARYSQALDRLLIPLVGAGNYTAQVHADLDFSEVQATRESYPKDMQAVRQENGGWTKEGGPDGPAIGIPGALSNTPPPASTLTATNPNQPAAPGAAGAPGAGGPAQPGTTAASEANRTTENYTRTYELGHEVSVTKNQVGQVKRLSVAVAIADGAKARRSPADIAAIERLVRGAVGADQARGDVVAVSARPFVSPDAEAAARAHWWEAPWVPLVARNLSALLVAALVVFGVARPLLKRRAAPAPAPASASAPAAQKGTPATPRAELGQQIAAAITEREAQKSEVTLEMIESAPGYQARAGLIRDFVKQDPARAALVVRDLIKSDAAREEQHA